MTYNLALRKKVNREALLAMGLDPKARIVLYKITDEFFQKIIEAGHIPEGLIVD